MKKLLSIVLALSLCLTAMMGCFVVSAETVATTATITVGTDSAKPGETVAITVTGANFTDVCAAELTIALPAELSLDSIYNGETKLENNDDGVYYVVSDDNVIKTIEIYNFTGGSETIATTDFTLTINATVSKDAAHKDYAIDAEIAGANINEDWLGIAVTDGTVTVEHTYEAAYDETNHWTACACGAVTENVAHTFEYTVAEDTHTANCNACDYVAEAAAHEYTDGACVCGDEEVVEVTKIAWAGSNITLGSALSMNFLIKQADITALGTTDNYAVVTTTFADGTADDVKTVPQSEWEKYNGGSAYWNIKSNGIPAKNMGDEIKVTIYNAKGQEITDERVDSPLLYAGRAFESASTTNAVKTLVVDMLNYGAASQTQLGYDTENLVNAGLTDEQKALATADFEYTASNIKGDNNLGSNLSLKDVIYLNFFFSNVTNDMTAKVIYTPWDKTEAETYEYSCADFDNYSTGKKVVVDTLRVSDGFQQVRVEIYNGTEMVAYGEDSIISYCARGGTDFYDAVAKFVKSSYTYNSTK